MASAANAIVLNHDTGRSNAIVPRTTQAMTVARTTGGWNPVSTLYPARLIAAIAKRSRQGTPNNRSANSSRPAMSPTLNPLMTRRWMVPVSRNARRSGSSNATRCPKSSERSSPAGSSSNACWSRCCHRLRNQNIAAIHDGP